MGTGTKKIRKIRSKDHDDDEDDTHDVYIHTDTVLSPSFSFVSF
jgi:hypothetical protein